MRWAAVALLVVLVASAILVLSPGTASAATPTFRILRIGAVNLFVSTLNPLRISTPGDYLVTYNTYSTLATFDGAYATVPELASSWSVSSNGTLWTLNLVHNAFFTDPTNVSGLNHPVTSADVVYSFQVQIANPSSVEHLYVQGISSVWALDPYTVQMLTPHPYAPMDSALVNVPILPRYIWSAQSNVLTFAPKYPVGSGVMYYDVVNTTSSLLELQRNPSYYGATDYCRMSRPTAVEFLSYSSAGTMATDFESGASGLNAVMGLDAATYTSSGLAPFPRSAVDTGFVGEFSIDVMSTAERATLISEGLSQFKTGSNNQLLLNPTVRQAIAKSINKSALVKYALLGLGDVADTLVPASNPWHYTIPAPHLYPFDPSAARAMLNAAGWAYDASGNPATSTTVPLYQLVNGTAANPLSFRFYTLNTAPEWAVAANNISAWLAQAGIQTTNSLGSPGYQLFSINQMSSAWFAANYDMWLWDWIFNPGSEPSVNILSVETTMAIGPTSDNYYSNATYDSLYNESLVTLNVTQRASILDQMQSMIYDFASYILPYYRWNLYAYRTDAPNSASTAWTGWGNWSRDPGLTPDSNLPNLWTQVYPAQQPLPTVHSFPPVQGLVGSPTTLQISASDADGDTLVYTWNFGDGTSLTTFANTTTHVYGPVGNYTVTVAVSDGEFPVCAFTVATESPNPSAPTYPASFTETGLPAGSPWSIVLNGMNISAAAGDTITFNVNNGTWSFDVQCGCPFTASPGSGLVTVGGAGVSTAITFYPPPSYVVSFEETGLPPGTQWSVTLGGTTQTTVYQFLTFTEFNGTYVYSIGAVAGFTTPIYTGVLVVSGGPVGVVIPWTQVTYHLTFTESGLASGTAWSVTLSNGTVATTMTSTATSITFVVPNGTYTFTVGPVAKYSVAPSSGTVLVNGADVTVSLTFHKGNKLK